MNIILYNIVNKGGGEMRSGKFKGFTLIELIVVIAIIAVLAVIIVPSMIVHVKEARASTVMANARSVYNGAKLALIDYSSVKTILPGEIYIGDDSGIAHASVNGSDDLSVGKYMGEDFHGHYAFRVSADGHDVEVAVWSNKNSISASDDEVKVFTYEQIVDDSTGKGIGSYPFLS